MVSELLHVFRNTPFGRETLMQSAFFCKRAELSMEIYIPSYPQFLMYFDHGVVTVDLDRAFLRSPDTAREHASEIADAFSVPHRFLEPTRFTVDQQLDPLDVITITFPSDTAINVGGIVAAVKESRARRAARRVKETVAAK